MKKLKVYLENCYGINRLEYEFDFSEKRVYSIYASNGTMKSSFARVFEDIVAGQKSKDLIHTDKKSVRKITQDGEDINPQSVYVIKPYNDFHYEKAASLLLNKELREQYALAHKKIEEKKEDLLDQLKEPFGMRNTKDIEDTISTTFASKLGEFFFAMKTAEPLVQDKPLGFADIIYSDVFSKRTEEFLSASDVQKNISDYMEKYESLIDSSKYFTKRVFNDYNAETIAKQLGVNGFFAAKHHVVLRDKRHENGQEEIKTLEALTEAIEREKKEIWENPDLISKFDKFTDKMTKHADLRKFREYLSDNPKIIPELLHKEYFKKVLLASYFQSKKDKYSSFMEAYREQAAAIAKIEKKAQEEAPKWKRVIDTYNQRFSMVPVQVHIENQSEVALGLSGPKVGFLFQGKVISLDILMDTLSTGEKKAMYILDIIFEVEDKISSEQETVFIIDDIADSFDYTNKYAILEYLRDISDHSLFCQIILTHNFDFHRTVSGRLGVVRNNRKNVVKTDTEILISEEKYQNNPFSDWINNWANDNAKLIASIPFVRNIAKFQGYTEIFNNLTRYLHIKEDSQNLTIGNLVKSFKQVLHGVKRWPDSNSTKVLDLICTTADDICNPSGAQIQLEHKVALSIAIRLRAEKFIIGEIGEKFFNKDQTYSLIAEYKKAYKESPNMLILVRVNLMTPENIHLNSFMYEPLLDMDAHHLIRLYEDVCNMKEDK